MNPLSKICLGTAQFGLDYGINNQVGKLAEAHIKDILDYAWHVGIVHLDAADAYGETLERLGRYFLHSSESFVVHNKFSAPADRSNIEEKLSRSLKLMNIDEVETYYFHNYFDFINHPSYLDQMVALKTKNLIKRLFPKGQLVKTCLKYFQSLMWSIISKVCFNSIRIIYAVYICISMIQ